MYVKKTGEDMTCIWKLEDEEYALWQTECGHLHSFTVDGPVENKHKFCPYCGKMIKTFYEIENGGIIE